MAKRIANVRENKHRKTIGRDGSIRNKCSGLEGDTYKAKSSSQSEECPKHSGS